MNEEKIEVKQDESIKKTFKIKHGSGSAYRVVLETNNNEFKHCVLQKVNESDEKPFYMDWVHFYSYKHFKRLISIFDKTLEICKKEIITDE